MKNEITLKMVKFALALVLVFTAMSCSDDLNLTKFNGLDDAIVAQGADSREANAKKGGSGGVSVTVTTWSTDFLTVGCVGDELSFKINGVGGREAKIAESVAGDYIPLVKKNASDESTILEYKTTFNTAGSYTLYYQVGGQNGSNGFQSFTFVIEDCNPCEETFSYVSNGNDTYTFTYIPRENMIAAQVVFTFSSGFVVSGFPTSENWGSNNNGNMQATMDFEACEEYQWTLTFSKDCSGNGNKNLWTDFKVNDVSKKGSLSNIDCK